MSVIGVVAFAGTSPTSNNDSGPSPPLPVVWFSALPSREVLLGIQAKSMRMYGALMSFSLLLHSLYLSFIAVVDGLTGSALLSLMLLGLESAVRRGGGGWKTDLNGGGWRAYRKVPSLLLSVSLFYLFC